ncbi:LPD7 domain-containing protein [Proteus mirabilis]|uniref:LPD7 domain-containing protein n=1 Tax=Morganellaceae TaxID=1903414 RepID=UPI002348F755|nr:LPD7 domain-containing protein [Providencia sp. PROV271]
MLSRIGGGNSGIVYYLETGQKQGRELGRDDLDYRLCLDGNIEQLDHVIESIPDKGQERYLHISLSFHENHVNEETLKAVCEEYKTLLMNAYDKDEYCFYAEAHIPKVKNVVDEKTGVLIERKPHIHIVIPRKNMETGKALNPVGDMTKGSTIKNLDSIQEHINNKFNLASPKDGVRVSDQNHANVLSRMKGDLFSEAKSEFKQMLISNIESKNIKSEKDFLTHLSQFGEVKTYNQGKANQYYGVKLPNETKFTRLKSPLFSKQFIETRTIPLIKPTPKQIEKDLSEWCNKTSHEIKHIHPAGEKLRKTYAKLNDNDKAEMLLTLRNQYNERHNIEREPRENIHGQLQRGRNSQRSFTSHTQRTQSRSAPQRLSSLQERNMVYELRGYRQRTTQQSNPILPSNERGAIKNEQSGQYHRGGMRRSPDSRGGRITNPIQQTLVKLESKPSENDLMLMREIRKTIEPERFLSYCVSKYNIDPELHKITFAKDNSPRFKVGKLNLNASDFLTKHLGLSWEDAKIDLLSVNEAQQKNEPFLSVLSRVPLNAIQSKERTLSRENAKKQLNAFYRDERKMLETNYKLELKQLYGIKDHRKREVERGFIMFNHLKQIDALNKITQTKRSTVNAIHNHWKPNDLHQQVLLKNVLTEKGNYMTNKIMNSDTDFSFEKSVARKRQFNEFEDQVKNGQKLTDLVAHKKDKEVEYLNQKTKEVVFKDTGTHIEAKSVISKNEAAMMLEYAEKKYGGALRLSGSEAFKETIALTAAEKGMKIILEPEKYHNMMLKEAERIKSAQDQQKMKELDVNTIMENASIKIDLQAPGTKTVEAVNVKQEQTSNQENKPIYFVFEGRTGLVHTDTDKNEAERIFNKWSEQANTSNNYKHHEKDVVMYEKQLNQQELEKLANINKQSPLNLSLSTLKKEFKVTQADEVKSNLSTKANEFIDKPSNQNAIIDGKDFNKLIVVPVHKDDGFEKSVVFKVAFKHDDKMVTQLKDVTESDLNRMGIDTKNIDMRKVEPISIDITKLANANVESPLKHAEKQLNAHVEHMKSKQWSRSEFDELKEQRGKLEANVDKAKAQHTPEQTQQNEHKKAQEQNKGQSL